MSLFTEYINLSRDVDTLEEKKVPIQSQIRTLIEKNSESGFINSSEAETIYNLDKEIGVYDNKITRIEEEKEIKRKEIIYLMSRIMNLNQINHNHQFAPEQNETKVSFRLTTEEGLDLSHLSDKHKLEVTDGDRMY